MHPILFKIGPLTIYSYGLMVAAGFGAAIYLALRQAHKFGLKKENVIDICLYILIAGLAGARILYVLLNLDYYRSNPIEIFYISRGGLVWYGAFFFGLLAGLLYAVLKKISFRDMADLMAPYIALGQSIGRLLPQRLLLRHGSGAGLPAKGLFPGGRLPQAPDSSLFVACAPWPIHPPSISAGPSALQGRDIFVVRRPLSCSKVYH